jgi:hypothetical protein
MAKDRNGKEIEVGDEIVLVLRVEEIVPKGGNVAVVRAAGVHGASAKYPERYEAILYPDQVILQRKGRDIKPRGCGVRGCGRPMPHAHAPDGTFDSGEFALLDPAADGGVPTPEGETCHSPDCDYSTGHTRCRSE